MTSLNEPWADSPSHSGAQAAPTAPSQSDTKDGDTKEVAKQEASNVAQSATGAAQQVAGTAKEQVAVVATEAKDHVRNLAGETRDQVASQATAQRDKAVSGLRSLAGELQSLASGKGGTSGLATQLAGQAGDTTHKVAGYLEQREPRDLLDDLSALARRRPGAFLLGAAIAGVAAGRLTRALASPNGTDVPSRPALAAPSTPSIDMPVVPAPTYAQARPYAESDRTVVEPLGGDVTSTSAYATEWSDPAGSARREPGSGPVIP